MTVENFSAFPAFARAHVGSVPAAATLHYLMLTISLLYAAVIHPRECHQIAYGLAYLFIFPAMHLLLPIYSVANIIDQSWGTRDSQTAKIPKLKCMPSFKKLMKLRKSKTKSQLNAGEDNSFDIQTMVSSIARSMSDGSPHEKKEFEFWESLRTRLLGNDVNTGLEKAELAERLRRLRNRSLTGLMVINALWLALLSYFYVGVESPCRASTCTASSVGPCTGSRCLFKSSA
ncbi:hypothetical protein C0Q70_09558 [Pomacea canaliculata]|uniref:Uncharacterized protein n=1 Tax=Pomacea canaliculata TaxID=400727 RepID=A0A2T7PA45_POMCA|nr:hypothetical protein C0Q70_09558 [Pomacea canaliculata]